MVRRQLLAVALVVSGVTAGAATAESTDMRLAHWQPLIAEAARRFNIPESWIRDVMRAESAGRTTLNGAPIVSSAGAMGLMQIMPTTWVELRDRHRLGNDPHDPRDNILAGAAYLREMYERFGAPMFFAAYHAGPQRVEQYLSRGAPLPRETRAYLAALADSSEVHRNVPQSVDEGAAARAPLFALVKRASAIVAHATADGDSHRLFAVLNRADLRRERKAPTVQPSLDSSAR